MLILLFIVFKMKTKTQRQMRVSNPRPSHYALPIELTWLLMCAST